MNRQGISMYTIIETTAFIAHTKKLWTTDERLEFFTYLSQNPTIGDVIKGGQGLRKIRWAKQGRGKRGGIRIIYFNVLDDGYIILLSAYAKNDKENISQTELYNLQEVKDDYT